MKLGDPELHLPPTYDLDQKVRVTKVIRNDGTYPGEVTGKRLAEKGDEGYVIGIGTYLQTAYIYSVHFLETNRIVGCLGLELELAEDLSKPKGINPTHLVRGTAVRPYRPRYPATSATYPPTHHPLAHPHTLETMTSTKPKISELLTQPGCEHNHEKNGKGHNKACKQQAKPGAAQGGCAFDGASITLVPITDAAHLVHGPIACSGNSWGGRGSLSSGPLLYKMGFTTDLSENDIIFGGEKKLYKAIQDVKERYSPAAVFVYSTCVTALIGDDLDAVCKAAAEKFAIPGDSGACGGLYGEQEPGQSPRRRSAAGERHRHGGAGLHHALRHQLDWRIQHRGRTLGRAAAVR
jgi:hypothetical protein